MRILALILARGGSKRLPGKNIRPLGGKPLIIWSIDVATDVPEVCDILISTDDDAIADVCKQAGAYVPWLRPAELATDTATSVDAALHALDWYEAEKGAVDGVLLLQPTSPFRTKETLHKGVELFISNSRQSVIGVSRTHAHPMWTLVLDGDQLVPYLEEHGLGKRSQDLKEAYSVNGCFYLITPEQLRANKSFFVSKAQPLVIDSFQEELDIDTEKDWELAEGILNSNSNSQLLIKPDTDSSSNDGLSASAEAYLSENEAALSLPRQTLINTGKPREVHIASLGGIAKHKLDDALKGPVRYLREIFHGWEEVSRLTALKGSKKGKKAIVIGNGPSQDLISADALDKFNDAGNDIFAVNFWNQNTKLFRTPPNYLVISDSATLADPKTNAALRKSVLTSNEALMEYLLEHKNVTLCAPVSRIKYLKKIFGESRVLGFINTEMKWMTDNIDPRFPRGYISMTLYKALALAIHMGYEKIYLIGMDNTYPRDIFCDHENKILNYERHAGINDFLIDQTSLTPSMDVWAQDVFQLFSDLRRCFSGSEVLNLDCYSLTDVFPKISNLNQIEILLNEP